MEGDEDRGTERAVSSSDPLECISVEEEGYYVNNKRKEFGLHFETECE